MTDNKPTTTELKSGWGHPCHKHKIHYFYEGQFRSLCGEYSRRSLDNLNAVGDGSQFKQPYCVKCKNAIKQIWHERRKLAAWNRDVRNG